MSDSSLQFTSHTGLVAPLDKANVDTDQIIPKQFLISIKKTGFGENLFDAWRYEDEGYIGKPVSERQPITDFVLNQERYQGASILLARENFACGSSREHAVWALQQSGFRVVIAPSFADIFYNNSFNNGLLPVALSSEAVDSLFELESISPIGLSLKVDLESQTVQSENNINVEFDIDPIRKERLLKGLDEIGLSLEYASEIKQFESQHQLKSPWLFNQSN